MLAVAWHREDIVQLPGDRDGAPHANKNCAVTTIPLKDFWITGSLRLFIELIMIFSVLECRKNIEYLRNAQLCLNFYIQSETFFHLFVISLIGNMPGLRNRSTWAPLLLKTSCIKSCANGCSLGITAHLTYANIDPESVEGGLNLNHPPQITNHKSPMLSVRYCRFFTLQ